jgi:hypothetical protein
MVRARSRKFPCPNIPCQCSVVGCSRRPAAQPAEIAKTCPPGVLQQKQHGRKLGFGRPREGQNGEELAGRLDPNAAEERARTEEYFGDKRLSLEAPQRVFVNRTKHPMTNGFTEEATHR